MSSINLSTTDIKRIVSQIRDQVKAGTPEYKIRFAFRDFQKQMPHLFDAAMNPTFQLQYLDMMLGHIQQAQELKNKKDKEQLLDKADEAVIGALREVYLDPLLANAPKLEAPQEPVVQVIDDGGAQVSIHEGTLP